MSDSNDSIDSCNVGDDVVAVVTIERDILVFDLAKLRSLQREYELDFPIVHYLNNSTKEDMERKLMADYTVTHGEKAREQTDKAMDAICNLRAHAAYYALDRDSVFILGKGAIAIVLTCVPL